jgi:hypothetical protein
MAITGKFQADFSQFNTEVEKATGKLKGFEGGSTSTVAALGKMDSATKRTSTGFGDLSSGLRTADKTLSQFGINLGSEIQAIEEIGAVAGKTAKDIGLIGTAGLAVGAGLAGWKIGRMAAEFFDLDTKVANTAARLLGWGDVAGQTAAAKADTLAKASGIAKREITDMGEAVRIITDDHKKHLATLKDVDTTSTTTAASQRELAKAEREAAAEAKAAAAEQARLAEKIRDIERTNIAAGWGGMAEEIADVGRKGAKPAMEDLDDFNRSVKQAADAAKAAEPGIEAPVQPLARVQQQAAAATNAMYGLATQMADFKEKGDAGWFGWSPTGAGGMTLPRTGPMTVQAQSFFGPGVFTPPPRQHGGPVSAGRPFPVGEKGPELFVPGSSGNIVPGGGGITVNLTVQGSVFGGSRQLGDEIGDAVMRRARQHGMRFPTGA